MADNEKKAIVCDPTYDLTFKRLFAEDTEEGRARTIEFLNSLLNLKIRRLEFKNKKKEDKYEKTLEYDILCSCECECEGETIIDIEMQRRNLKYFFTRTVFYGATQLVACTPPGTSYYKIPKVIVLSFLDYSYPEYRNKPVLSGRFLLAPLVIEKGADINPKMMTDIIQLYYFQLPAIGEMIKERKDLKANGFSNSEAAKDWLSVISCKYIIDEKARGKDDEIEVDMTEISNKSRAKEAIRILEEYRDGDLHKEFIEEQKIRDQATRDKKSEIEEAERKVRDELDVVIKQKNNEIQQNHIEIEKLRKKYIKDGYKKFCKDKKMTFSKRLKKMQEEYDKDKNFGNRVKEFLLNKKTSEGISTAEEQIERFVDKIRNAKIEDCLDSDSEIDE